MHIWKTALKDCSCLPNYWCPMPQWKPQSSYKEVCLWRLRLDFYLTISHKSGSELELLLRRSCKSPLSKKKAEFQLLLVIIILPVPRIIKTRDETMSPQLQPACSTTLQIFWLSVLVRLFTYVSCRWTLEVFHACCRLNSKPQLASLSPAVQSGATV